LYKMALHFYKGNWENMNENIFCSA
jgi:hypothetical protein